ncbi:MAG: membrane protein insertase YidC [Bacteroidota bacterium]
MDRNSIIGLVIIAGILVVFSLMNQPSEQELAEAKRVRDSITRVQEQKALEAERIAKEQAVQQKETTPEVDSSQLFEQQYGTFAQAASGEQKLITLENDKVKVKITTKGGRIYSVELKDYQTYGKEPLVLFSGDKNKFGFNFFAQNRSISTNELFFQPDREEQTIEVRGSEETLRMRLYAGEGKYMEYSYSLDADSYALDFDVRFVNMQEIMASNSADIDLEWEMVAPQLEKGKKHENDFTTIAYKFFQDEVETMSSRGKDVDEEEINNRLKWVAFKQQFFSSILVADDHLSNAFVEFESFPEESEYLKRMHANIGVPAQITSDTRIPMTFYFVPNHYTSLKKYDKGFEELIPLGWGIFAWVNRIAIIPVFNFLNNFIANYGIIILILTILIKLVLFPLTYKSYVSTAKMRVLKPEIEEIGKRYPKKDEAMKKQQATMNLYKRAGVSPMGGCLPMLVQLPILIAMFRFFPASIELRQESFLWADDLSSYDSIFTLPFEIPYYGDHVSLFTLLMAVALVFTSRLNSSQMADTNQQMPGMKFMMTYMMPVMLLFVFNNYSSGLSYYYFLSNVITLGQTLIIRNFVDEDALLRKLHENKKKPAQKSKFQQRLEEAAKQRGKQPPKKKK